jgi:hypothetical protein
MRWVISVKALPTSIWHDGGGAVVGVEAAPETCGRDRRERLRQCDHRLVREAGENHLLEPLELRAHRRVDARVGVTEQRHPPGAHGIEIAPAVVVLEPRALAAAYGDQRQLALVVLHLRARVPHVREVADYEVGVCGGHAQDCGTVAP